MEDYEGVMPLWVERIEYLAHAVISAHRKGQPVREVGVGPIRTTKAYRLKPILPANVPTVLFGNGGTGKSYLALVLGLLVQTGEYRLGLEPHQGDVLYLDYETHQDDVHERVKALKEGLGLPGQQIIRYRRCEMPLVREIDRIANLVSEYGIDLLIVDSVGQSLGGTGNDDQVVNEYFRSLRGVRTTILLVDHVAKNALRPTPFGSAYKNNSARSTWEVKAKRSSLDQLSVGVWHRKVNEGNKFPSLGFEFQFTNNEHNRVERTEVKRQDTAEQFFEDMGDLDRIKEVLGEEGKIHYKDLALAIGLTPKTTSVYLSRLKRAGEVIQLGGGAWGLSTPQGDEIAF